MFGIGFTELLLIAIIGILFLGPDKLPSALVEMAKFIKSVKKTVGDAKSSLEEEMKIADLKEEALGYKKQLNDATNELKGFKNLNFDDFDDVSYDDDISTKSPKEIAQKPDSVETPTGVEEAIVATQVEAKNDTVTFKNKTKLSKNDEKSNKGDA
ncbi:MAG: Sec-independent protein translocase subunit TatB [Sulfurovum sp.]|nr:Sec-independent protein translocase subunit TatB [Sulfurovum sp.]